MVLNGYDQLITKIHIQRKRNPVKCLNIQKTKEKRLKTFSKILCSHPTSKQRLVDTVADAINDSPPPNLSTRKSDADEGRFIVMTAVKFEASGVVFLKAYDSDILFLCLVKLI